MGKNFQKNLWCGEFGKDYTERNIESPDELDNYYNKVYGVTRSCMNNMFLQHLDLKDKKILEVGCNVGNQLRMLQRMGYKNLYGIELQSYAVQRAKELTKDINIIQGVADDIPFKDEYFDIVFTSGVLIHINPKDLPNVMKEIARCSKKYIWGFEYYADEFQEVNYRGNDNALWRGYYATEYIKNLPGLKILKQEKFKYLHDSNMDQMFILEK